MPNFNKPHIDVSGRLITRSYQAPRQNIGGGGAPRIRDQHAARIEAEMKAAFVQADQSRPTDDRITPPEGVYLEVDLQRGSAPDKTLERKRDKIRPGASQRLPSGEVRVALFVPDDARPVLEKILNDYKTGPLNRQGEPPKQDKVEPIEAIRQARLETFWTDDPEVLPDVDVQSFWWEVWCFPEFEGKVVDAANTIGCVVSENHYWLKFPETTVIQLQASRVEIELLLFATGGIAELRRASSTPVFFLDQNHEDQLDWNENLAERVTWPGTDAPAVCILDTGVNRAHMLIEPALSHDDLLTINADWEATDHHGHGTGMAGLSLFGDLTPRLEDENEIELRHRIESVKLLPPDGFPANDPQSYGSITQSATSIAEINKPERDRVFCLAVTNENVSGARATTWSSAIDQAANGSMPGDDDNAPKRLFVISAGNAPPHIEVENILSADELPIEDPAQAWNAISVGGYTNKTLIDDEGYEDWTPFAEAGDISPFTRTAVTWPRGRSPNKPDIVMEAGNRALSPAETEVLSLDSLALLTTGEDVGQHPLAPFAATSAAAAQAARLATQLSVAYPDAWPETIRALMVHSAEWTPSMLYQLNSAESMQDRYPLLRTFGHGVPSYERAIASANNHLALIAENEIAPFQVEDNQKKFGDCHFYKLPWPKDVLENLGENDVRLKVTLSYFIDPNPGRFASIDAQRYQSFGLRFDLKRRSESTSDFVKRVNAKDRENPLGRGPSGGDNSGWKFGPNSIGSGSLHCDEWIGPAVQLAARDVLCIKPVTGWWRNSAKNCRNEARYSLVVTISAPDQEIDLYTPISALVENAVDVEISIGR